MSQVTIGLNPSKSVLDQWWNIFCCSCYLLFHVPTVWLSFFWVFWIWCFHLTDMHIRIQTFRLLCHKSLPQPACLSHAIDNRKSRSLQWDKILITKQLAQVTFLHRLPPLLKKKEKGYGSFAYVNSSRVQAPNYAWTNTKALLGISGQEIIIQRGKFKVSSWQL